MPILKSGSDFISSYRPNSLISMLGKTFKKVLNKRLIWFLESNNLLSVHQYGFKKGRSTLHALAEFQVKINADFLPSSHCYSIFSDLNEIYSRIWRHHICQCGGLPKVIQDLLSNWRRTYSENPEPVFGVLQGSVYSVIFFVIAINDIVFSKPSSPVC